MTNKARLAYLTIQEKQSQVDKAKLELTKFAKSHVELISPVKIGDEITHKKGRVMKVYDIRIKEIDEHKICLEAIGYFKSLNGTAYTKRLGVYSVRVTLDDL